MAVIRAPVRAAIAAISLCLALALAPPAAFADPVRTAKVASFNIQFLGQFRSRMDGALADLLEPYDVVIVQELVAPPHKGLFPDATSYRPDPEAARFFAEMEARGFDYHLSEEDTGTGNQRHVNSSATEWFVVFYRRDVARLALDLPGGFLGEDRYDHPDFERVPYAFGIRLGSEDLVFISVHLQPGGGGAQRARRAQELSAIFNWIGSQPGAERDYVIVGDMNIEDCDELASVMPAGFASLNRGCLPTNANPRGPKPYDQVMFSLADTTAELGTRFDVIDLVAAMRSSWDPDDGPYPGDPYVHDDFRQVYSDHHPISFEILIDGVDDD